MTRCRNESGQFSEHLPRYYDNGVSYLELHQNRTCWKLENDKKSDDDYLFLVEEAIKMFKEKTSVEIFLLGRSGRHVCVQDIPENSKRYIKLEKLSLELEKWVIEQFNNKDLLDKECHCKMCKSKSWYKDSKPIKE